jgi:hypothetical protein
MCSSRGRKGSEMPLPEYGDGALLLAIMFQFFWKKESRNRFLLLGFLQTDNKDCSFVLMGFQLVLSCTSSLGLMMVDDGGSLCVQCRHLVVVSFVAFAYL